MTRPPSPCRGPRPKGGTRELVQPEHLATQPPERHARVNFKVAEIERRAPLAAAAEPEAEREARPGTRATVTGACHHTRPQHGQGPLLLHSQSLAAKAAHRGTMAAPDACSERSVASGATRGRSAAVSHSGSPSSIARRKA